jgi:hypothetical protein
MKAMALHLKMSVSIAWAVHIHAHDVRLAVYVKSILIKARG